MKLYRYRKCVQCGKSFEEIKMHQSNRRKWICENCGGKDGGQ